MIAFVGVQALACCPEIVSEVGRIKLAAFSGPAQTRISRGDKLSLGSGFDWRTPLRLSLGLFGPTDNVFAPGRLKPVLQRGRLKPVLQQIAILVCLLAVGCGERNSDPEMSFSKFDTWKVPAAGRFLPAPRGLYADENDTVYVLDDAGRVLVYDKTGQLQRQWEMPEFAAGKPEGVWKLVDGRVAVADTHYHRVVIFHPDGSMSHKFGTQGTGAGQFVFPVTIAQDPKGFIYVGEYGDRQRIQKFTPDGVYVTEFGQHGSMEGEFQRPSGVAWREGMVYVVDAFNDRIQVFEDGGKFVRVINLPEKSAPLEYPYDIRLDKKNQIYVIENKAARLTVMRLDGTIVGRYGRPGRGLNQFYQPWDLTVLSDGRILVADTGNHRLVELTP